MSTDEWIDKVVKIYKKSSNVFCDLFTDAELKQLITKDVADNPSITDTDPNKYFESLMVINQIFGDDDAN